MRFLQRWEEAATIAQRQRVTGDASAPGSIGHGIVGDGGYAVALTGLLLVPLLIFTAFAVDVGSWYAQGTEQQRAADAAALAAVVWVDNPSNPTLYQTVGLDVAARNGYQNGTGGVSVSITKVSGNRVQATITAPRQRYFSSIIYPASTLTRRATAEYNLPVPLGSPRNYLGTGWLTNGPTNTAYERENIWLAISGYCTDKQQGDRKAARYAGPVSNPGDNPCSGATNSEYSPTNYEFYIELPAGRTYATDVLIFGGSFFVSDSSATNCSSLKEGSPDEPVSGTQVAGTTREGCPGSTSPARSLMGTTFTLYQADATPLDDSDNPPMTSVGGCSNVTSGLSPATTAGALGQKYFGPRGTKPGQGGSPETNLPAPYDPPTTNPDDFFGRTGWWRLCRIPASAPAGRYILRVNNQDLNAGTDLTVGSNAFSIVADRVGASGLCDSRMDAMCPRVYAKDYLSIYARKVPGKPQGTFFLAEVGQAHAGKLVQIELWDFAENAQLLEILKPTGGPGACGTASTWANQSFRYKLGNGSWSGTVTSVSPTSAWNGQLVTLEFNLPASWGAGGANPPVCNSWFKVRTTYSDTLAGQDRTTWSLKIIGDPVHLVD
jgi:hypothetical protein